MIGVKKKLKVTRLAIVGLRSLYRAQSIPTRKENQPPLIIMKNAPSSASRLSKFTPILKYTIMKIITTELWRSVRKLRHRIL